MSTKKRHKKCKSFAKESNKKISIEFSDEEGDNLLHLAVVADIDTQTMTNICQFVVKNFGLVGINSRNNLLQTPLHIASCIGNQNLVKLLIDFGADISAVDRNIENAIHLAVKYGNSNCLEALVSKCSDNNALNALNINGLSPLHLCVECGHESAHDMIKVIANSGADINVRDGLSGRTPLMYCLMKNQKHKNSLKNTLLSLNASISQTDYSGSKAIDIMEENDI